MDAKPAPYPEYRPSLAVNVDSAPSHWVDMQIRRSVDGCVNGFWGGEPTEEIDSTIVLRVADFDRQKMRIKASGYTFRSISDREYKSRALRAGDLLLEKSGGGEKTLVGQVVLFDHNFPAITSNFVAKMSPLAGFDSSFLNYVFSRLYEESVNVRSIKQNTGIQNLDSGSYLSEKLAVPPYDEQKKISQFLDHETAKIDTLIARQQKLIELLKEKRQAVISHAVTKGLNPDAKMKDSGVEWLGEIPAHWSFKPLKHVVQLQRGHDLPQESRKHGSYPVVSSGGVIDYHNESRAFSPGIVTGRYGSIGQFTIVDHDYWPLNTALYTSDTRGNNVRFLWYLLQNISHLFVLNSMKSAVPGVDRNDVHPELIALPTAINEQRKIAKYLDSELAKLEKLSLQIRESIKFAEEKRAAVISSAVTGKIDARNWQPPSEATEQPA